MINLEHIIISKLRKLSIEKQEDVLQFLDLIEEDLSGKQTTAEIEQANEILERAKRRALKSPLKSPSQLWNEFNQAKSSIYEAYEVGKDSGVN
jgi:cell division septum initiation protein DivIVA